MAKKDERHAKMTIISLERKALNGSGKGRNRIPRVLQQNKKFPGTVTGGVLNVSICYDFSTSEPFRNKNGT